LHGHHAFSPQQRFIWAAILAYKPLEGFHLCLFIERIVRIYKFGKSLHMKRNKLLSTSPHAQLFTSPQKPHRKSRHLISLSLLALGGIFVSNMLLATSQPPSLEQSQNISLPGQVSNSIATDAEVKTQSLNLALAQPVLQTNIAPSVEHISVEDVLSDETIIESAEIEQLHLDTLPVEVITQSNDIENIQAPIHLKWETLTVQSGDNLSKLFPKVGLTARDVYLVMQAGDITKPLLNLKPGQILRFGLDDSTESLRLNALELVYNPVETLRLTSVNDTYEAETVVKKLDTRRQ
jgi:cell envelope opacity-associated protein A